MSSPASPAYFLHLTKCLNDPPDSAEPDQLDMRTHTPGTGKQCRERWHNQLDPNIKKEGWSEEEDRVLLQAHTELGNHWVEISKVFSCVHSLVLVLPLLSCSWCVMRSLVCAYPAEITVLHCFLLPSPDHLFSAATWTDRQCYQESVELYHAQTSDARPPR